MKTDKRIIENMKKLGLGPENEKEFINFILNTDTDTYKGRNRDGENENVTIQKSVGILVCTYKNDGSVRKINYNLVENEDRSLYINESETYEKICNYYMFREIYNEARNHYRKYENACIMLKNTLNDCFYKNKLGIVDDVFYQPSDGFVILWNEHNSTFDINELENIKSKEEFENYLNSNTI